MKYNPGDFVEITAKDSDVKGTIMPSNNGFLVIKLENGYNVGIDKKKIKDVKILKRFEEKKMKKNDIKPNKKLPAIAILHAGGTIASKIDYQTGGVIASFTPEELVKKFPELNKMANIRSRLIANMMSENMRFGHYNVIAKAIKEEIEKGVEGIIITHGTDTLHYTSAALSFILENLSVPVILVGSQRSSDRGSTDAVVNIISATAFITGSDFAEVGICMHESMNDKTCVILPGLKSRKMHTSRRDTFRAINSAPYARIDYITRKTEMLRKDYRKKGKGKLSLKLFNENIKVTIIKSHPNMFAESFTSFMDYEGIILEGTGLGHAPVTENDIITKEHSKIKNAIKKLAEKNVVVMSPQPTYGRVQMNVYSSGRDLLELGVLGNYSDMTPETTLVKLAWLLSNFKKEEVKKLMSENIRGELSERLSSSDFLR